MKAPKILIAALMGGVLLVSAAPAPAQQPPAYVKYVACGVSPKAKAARKCPAGSKKGAFFKATRGSVDYSICVDFPRGKTLCAQKQRADRGTLYVNRITSNIPGVHKVTWFVKGKRVGVYRFRVT